RDANPWCETTYRRSAASFTAIRRCQRRGGARDSAPGARAAPASRPAPGAPIRRACVRLASVDGVDTYFARYRDSPIVLDVLGTADPDEVRAIARGAVPDADEIFLFECSVGALF